jgi:hypothetical protein
MISSLATNWKEKALRLEHRFEKFREQGLAVAERGANAGLTVVGGAGAAFAAVYMPTIPTTQVPTDLAVGGLVTALGVFDVLGGMAEQATAFGSGLLAVGTYRQLEPMLRQSKAA